MTRVLAISDIHGCYDEFCEMLNKVKFNPENDKLILLGDYVDRGYKSKQVVELVKNLVDEHGAIALKGNHDDMFVRHMITDTYDNAFNHMRNGGLSTFQSYYGTEWELSELWVAKKFIMDYYKDHVEFLRDLPYYYETEEYIFVHAGINPFYEDWENTPYDEMIWIRDLFINNKHQTGKIVIFGHTPCTYLHGTEDVWFGGDKIGIDGACAYGFQLNCLEIYDVDGYKAHVVFNKSKLNKNI